MKPTEKSLVHTIRRRAVALLGAVVLLAGLAVGAASVAQAASGTGTITGYEGLCLDDRSASTALFNPVQVYSCNGTGAQQWTVVQSGSTIRVFGMCMDIAGGGTTDGTKVDLYTCNGTGAQVWIPESNHELYNPQSNKCLDDTGFGGSGTQLQIWDCADSSNQQWILPAGAV